MKLNQISLAARNAFIYFVLFIAGLGVSGYVLFSYSAKEILSLTQESLEHNGEMVALKFETYLSNVETDLDQLAHSPLLNRYMSKPDLGNLDALTDEYKAFLKAKLPYFQVRLIAEKTGDELIRVERRNQSIYAADFTDLQNKKDRDYFTEIVRLPLDSIYFSKIDLNREYDQISEPIIPTLRIAKLLHDDSLGGVMVIINVDLKGLFSDLKESLPKEYELRVLNQQGHYLIHPDAAKEFTFEYNKAPQYNTEFDQPFETIWAEHKPYSTNQAEYKFLKLNYKRPNYELLAIVSANNSTVFASFYSWRKKVLLVSTGIALLFLIVAFAYMRRQVKELKAITRELTLFSDRPSPQKLTIDRKDEIGELARGFEQMSRRISESHLLLENARREAEQAFQEKNEFLENMSHEIRNPLQSILGTVQILEQNQVGDHQKPFINSLRFSAEQLKSLVTDVLDYSKIKNDQIELKPEWTNLDEFCQNLTKATNYQAITKGIELNYEAFDTLTENRYLLDRTRLYQILNNLLTNALKFTSVGGAVTIRVSEVNGSESVLLFEVIDNGEGISADDLTRILERNFTSNYVTGAGLGLTIVQKLLHLFQTELHIESNQGQGSRFFFELPLESQSKTEQSINGKNAMLNGAEKAPTVLVLEDDLELQHWYRFLLEGAACDVVSALQDVDANKRYDLIITDLNLGEENLSVEMASARLKPFLNLSGDLIVVSGTSLPNSQNELKSFLKPVKKEQIWNVLAEAFVRVNFGKPNFESFENDYDHQAALVANALAVLATEWLKDQKALTQAITNKNTEAFDQIKHKIITSVRRLGLYDFEKYLNQLSKQLTKLSEPDLSLEAERVEFILSYYISVIKQYA